MIKLKDLDSAAKDLIKKTGDSDPKVSAEAMAMFTEAVVSEPVERAVFDGDNVNGIFEPIDATEENGSVPFPKDPIATGTEDDYAAYTMPESGAAVPLRHVDGDETWVTTYRVANSIDWNLSYARNSRLDVISRLLDVYEAGFTKKNNDDGWTVILAAAGGKGTMYSDTAASVGVFTKKAFNMMKIGAQRSGGNATSLWNFDVTDLYISPEAMGDVRNWTLSSGDIDETTMRDIFVNDGLAKLYGAIVHIYPEFGVGQPYQVKYDALASKTSMTGSDEEIFVGLDLDPRKRATTFVQPFSEMLSTYDDPTLHRSGKAGVYGWTHVGSAVLDSRATFVGSF